MGSNSRAAFLVCLIKIYIMKFVRKYFDRILWVALLLVLLFTFKQCNDEKNKAELIAKTGEALVQKVKTDSANIAQERKAFEAEKKELQGKADLSDIEVKEADNKVRQQQRTIDRLTTSIRNQPASIDTSNAVLVSSNYKQACDSLPAEIDLLKASIADKDNALVNRDQLHAQQLLLRNEQITREQAYSDSLRIDFNTQTSLLKSALKQAKPRGRLLVGIGIMGNEKQLLSGASVKGAYQSKGGKQYQLAAHAVKNPVNSNTYLYYEGSVFFSLFK